MSNPEAHKPPVDFVRALVVIVAFASLGVWYRPDLASAIIATCGSVATAMKVLQIEQSRTRASMNSRLDELLAVTSAAAFAEGKKEGEESRE